MGELMASIRKYGYFSPVVDAANDGFSSDFFEQMVRRLGLWGKRLPQNKQYKSLAASLVYCIREMDARSEELLAFAGSSDYWNNRTKIGRRTTLNFLKACKKEGWLTVEVGHSNSPYTLGRVALHSIGVELRELVITDNLKFASSKYLYSHTQKGEGKGKAIGADGGVADQINEFNRPYPLVSDDGAFHAATRSFGNDSCTRGGRYFAPWSNMPRTKRHSLTIVGSGIVEVDIAACHPTIMAAMTGKIPDIWKNGHSLDLYDFCDPSITSRDDVKSLVTHMIGAGRHNKQVGVAELTYDPLSKTYSSSLFAELNGFNDANKPNKPRQTKAYKMYRDAINTHFPFMKQLEKGVLDSETLNFYESEVMTRATLAIQELGHPCYILHDCLIVQDDPQIISETIKAIGEAFMGICCIQGWPVQVRPAISVVRQGEKIERHPISWTNDPQARSTDDALHE